MSLRDLILRARAMVMPGRAERELKEELSFHIERETKKLIDQGMSADEAKWAARRKFGPPALAADQCRDERGTAFFDNTLRDLQYALRTFVRAPLTALTIVVTVSIGLGVVAVLYTILNMFLFRIDAVPNITEMYAVERPRQSTGGDLVLLTRQRFEALRAETHVFTDVYAAIHEFDLRVDGRTMSVSLASGSFLRVVGVNPVLGRGFDAADDSRAGGNAVLLLSDRGWERHFHRAPDVIGRTVLVNGAPFEIIGLMPPGFRGLEVSSPDLWAPLSRMADFNPNYRGNEDKAGVAIIGRLAPGVSRESARAQLAAWDSNQSAAGTDRTLGIDVVPRRGTIPQPLEVMALFAPLFLAFGLILMIGCANVANLLLARGVARQREIGIRLSVGASRPRIVRQLMTESVLLALVAAAGGYLVSRLALEGTVYFAQRSMPLDIGDVNLGVPAADWRVAMFLVLSAIGATAFFALLPALRATRIDPVRTLRGELVKEARPGRARNVLIGVQVFASALLLISAAIFLRSSIASSQFNPGFRTADTILLDAFNEPKRAAMLQAVDGEPIVTGFAAVRPPLLAPPPKALADTGAGKVPISYKFVSADYFDVLGIPIVRGRAFTAAERDEYPLAIVSESVARELWPNGDGIGETFRLEPELKERNAPGPPLSPESGPEDDKPMPARMVTVIGVSRDVPGLRLADTSDAGVFLPTSLDAPKTSFVARISGDPELARQTLLDHLSRTDPNMGQIVTMRTIARLEVFFLQIAFWVALVLGTLALLLTVSGLFSVLSYLVEQRRKEIGVRMALGATSGKVTRLMLAQTARPVLYGLLAGASLAAALAAALLATDAGAMIGEIVHVIDPVAYLSSLLLIVVACLGAAAIPASRAARLDPMKTLRQE